MINSYSLFDSERYRLEDCWDKWWEYKFTRGHFHKRKLDFKLKNV